MHFCTKHTLHPDPCLKLYDCEVPVVSETKFLGLIFDSKLSFKSHIACVKKKCLRAMNLLRVVSHTDWGADSTTLLRLYHSLVRSKLDYGCIVYGSARDSHLQSLDRVQNAALRVCLGAFRTTPISSLHVEANEPPLTLRRQKLALQYIVKLRSNPNNPAYASVFQPNFKPLFEAKPHTIPTLGLRIHESLTNCGVNLSCVAQHSSPATPPWFLHRPQFDFTLYNLGTKSNILPDHYLSCYKELVLTYEGYKKIFTDGSKQGGAVSAAAVAEWKVLVKRLPDHASIFSAEAIGILLALNIIEQSPGRHFLIISDSFSCIKALENRKLSNPQILEILELVHKLVTFGYSIHFIWVPSHIGIAGNAAADAAAKAALNLQSSMLTVPYSDFKSLINTYIKKRWQECWDVEANNKLHRVQPVIGSVTRHHLPRRDEVMIHRLRVGHTHLTHCYLLRQELPPRCEFCHLPLSVEHILITCSSFSLVRRKFYDGCDSLQELFKRFSPHVIVKFIKEIGFYCKI
jgi:ribonuclease HI